MPQGKSARADRPYERDALYLVPLFFYRSYGDPREVVRKLAGDKVADALGPIWGLNEEGEINNVWRWSGVPRLYFMMGKSPRTPHFVEIDLDMI